MKYRLLFLCLLFSFIGVRAANTVNLTPKPKSITVKNGTFALPTTLTVGVASIPDSIVSEASFFTELYAIETGKTATTTTDANPHVTLATATNMADEAYKLEITSDGITITATTTAGFFYAFQTILKILNDDLTLPCCVINDAPRFGYRGFMLDVARHFFSATEVKRVIDLMARYKLNAFHWHLTDDQGWRIPIDKYPKLTTVGATAPNCRMNDMTYGTWMSNRPYGPYFYTKEEIADVVEYANTRHIDIIPEVDMPGHFTAAMAAYPEYSCTPDATHTVETTGGIFSDVLNVGNPAAVQFAKDILTEVMQLFPTSKLIHIGGDECPVTAWQSNEDCKALMTKLGITKPRQLQSWFTREIGKFLIENGRRPVVWNESVTAENSNLDWVKEVNPIVFSWFPAENGCKTAANLGLQTMMTSYYHYYICRGQEPPMTNASVAGGTGNAIYTKTTYNYDPTGWGNATQLKLMTGVQGTFWTEHVVDSAYLEWLALPRLFAVAEAGWTPAASKNYDDFLTRFAADTAWLNRNNYLYCPNTIAADNSDKVMPSETNWYRIVNRTTDARKNRCIELLQEGSELIATYSGKNAQADRLWTNEQADSTAANYALQLWTAEPSPSGDGKYALVCKAFPDGSVNPTPTSANVAGRWDYDYTTKHYNFVLGEQAYGEDNGNYYYTIRSDKTSGMYMNSSLAGQGFAVNLYGSPNDGNCGQWTFVNVSGTATEDTVAKYDEFAYLEEGKYYRFTNISGGIFQGKRICQDDDNDIVTASDDKFASNVWRAVSVVTNDDNSQTLRLQSLTDLRWMTSTTKAVYGQGRAITCGSEDNAATIQISSTDGELTIMADSLTLFLGISSAEQANDPDVVTVAANAVRPQGTAWTVEPVSIWNLVCFDTEDNVLGIYYLTLSEGESINDNDEWPQLKNYEFESMEVSVDDNIVMLVYRRSAYSVAFDCYTDQGVYIGQKETTQTAADYTVAYPKLDYYSFVSGSETEGKEMQLSGDTTLTATYATDAYIGVEKVMESVSEIVPGNSYLIYDATTVSGRSGYRYIDTGSSKILQATSAEPATPYYTWTLTKSGTAFTVKNDLSGKYVPQLNSGGAIIASTTGDKFTFTLNSDGETWSIKGTNGLYWNGNAGSLTGWSQPHPYKLFTYQAKPYYEVAVVYQDESGNELYSSSALVKAGERYILYAPETYDSLFLNTIEGNEGLDKVAKHTTITLTYTANDPTGLASPTAVSAMRKGIFDLSGRRIYHPRKGLYIVNGKKVVIN